MPTTVTGETLTSYTIDWAVLGSFWFLTALPLDQSSLWTYTEECMPIPPLPLCGVQSAQCWSLWYWCVPSLFPSPGIHCLHIL